MYEQEAMYQMTVRYLATKDSPARVEHHLLPEYQVGPFSHPSLLPAPRTPQERTQDLAFRAMPAVSVRPYPPEALLPQFDPVQLVTGKVQSLAGFSRLVPAALHLERRVQELALRRVMDLPSYPESSEEWLARLHRMFEVLLPPASHSRSVVVPAP